MSARGQTAQSSHRKNNVSTKNSSRSNHAKLKKLFEKLRVNTNQEFYSKDHVFDESNQLQDPDNPHPQGKNLNVEQKRNSLTDYGTMGVNSSL